MLDVGDRRISERERERKLWVTTVQKEKLDREILCYN